MKIFDKMKIMTLILALSLSWALGAQEIPGAFSVRPANDASGKILTMEETILSRRLSPERLWEQWNGNGHLTVLMDGRWMTYDIATGDTSAYMASAPKLRAYTEGQSLYLSQEDGSKIPVAVSEDQQITYGQFVSRNEFGIEDGIFWAPDSTRLAFYRKDESRVTTFPLLDITTRTGSLREIKYPMAGMDSENVQLGIYDLASGKTVYVKAEDFGYDRYLTNITWTPDASKVLIQVLDRSQKHLKLNAYDAATGDFIRTILTEDNDRYVEPQDPVWFLKGSNDTFIYRTDNRDGFRNLYLCNMEGGLQRLTCTDADVTYVANDGKYVWYTSAEVSPVENHLFRIRVKKNAAGWKFGKPERLTHETGWHEIRMGPDCRHFTDSWSSLTTPRVTFSPPPTRLWTMHIPKSPSAL